MATVGARSEERLRTVASDLADVVRHALRAAPSWLDFSVVSGLRTVEEQQALFAKGRDEHGLIINQSAVVTYKDGVHRKSRHQFGRAVDIAAYQNDRVVWDPLQVAIRAAYVIGFAKAHHSVDLTGGVKWNWDFGHLELA